MDDIDEHLPTLQKYAEKCDTIVEFGVREGRGSTLAFIAGVKKDLWSYDLAPTELERLQGLADERGVKFHFTQTDILKPGVFPPKCDLLFIDTKHTYKQLKKELSLFGNLAKRWLVFHDTITFGRSGEDQSTPGLIQAIEEFLIANPHWEFKEIFTYNNGLTVLERRT